MMVAERGAHDGEGAKVMSCASVCLFYRHEKKKGARRFCKRSCPSIPPSRAGWCPHNSLFPVGKRTLRKKEGPCRPGVWVRRSRANRPSGSRDSPLFPSFTCEVTTQIQQPSAGLPQGFLTHPPKSPLLKTNPDAFRLPGLAQAETVFVTQILITSSPLG